MQRVLLILSFLLSYTFMSFAQTTKPTVFILTTGGTIASRTNAPMIEGPALVQAVPQLLDYAQIQVEEFSRIGSSRMTPAHWLRLAKRIEVLLAKNEAAGVVITHGTDTMEETAFFLNLTVRSRKPVILVGSMRSANEISADGSANLLNAVRVAVSKEARSKGVLLVLNEDISAARDVWKTHNRRVNTFRAPEYGFLGVVDPDAIVFYRSPIRPHTFQSRFAISNVEALPNVEMLIDFTAMDSSIVQHFVGRQTDGLVIGTFAGGRSSAGVYIGLKPNTQHPIPVVIASKVPGGRIVGNPNYQYPVVYSRDLPPHKARILLMLALTQTTRITEIQEIFDQY